MSESLTQTLVFDVQFGAIRGSAQARAAIEDMASSAMGSGTIKGIRSSVGALERDMKRVMASAFKGGLRTEGRELHKVFREGSDAIIKAREQVARIDNQLLIATDRAHRGRLMRDREALQKEIKSRNTSVESHISLLDAQASRQADMLETASRNAAKNWKQSVEKSGESFATMVDGALNLDSLDPSAMIKGFGKKFKDEMAPKLSQFGAKNAGKGGAMGGLGKAARMLGGAAAGIAGAAAAIGALVAIFAAAYGQTKKLNSALLEGATAADMMDVVATRGKGLDSTLQQLRDSAQGTAYAFRMSGEEVAQMMNQINEAGMQINEWKDYTKNAVLSMSEFATVTHQAFVASKAFGTSVSEISGFTATMFHEMGKGLDRVDEGFRMIFAGAQRSSMSTKQFFTSITEASSGMALYNFRLDDTVGLLLDMTSVLGEDLASAQSKMSGQYRNMGMEQRIQTVMNAGGSGVSANIMGADLERQAQEFDKNLSVSDPQIATVLEKVMLKSGKLDTEALGKMSEKNFGDMLFGLRELGDDSTAMQLENMVGLARGAKGGLTNVATNMGSLSRQGELVQQLMEGRSLLGDAGISSFEGLNRQAYESTTGRSGEDFEILQRIDRDLRAEYRAGGGEEKLGKFEKWAVGALGDSSALAADALKAQPIMERLARDTMMETRSIAQTLKNVIASSLEGIYNFVMGIWKWALGGSAQYAAVEKEEAQIDKFYEDMETEYDNVAAADKVLKDPKSTLDEISAAQVEKAGAKQQIANREADIKLAQSNMRRLAMGDDALIYEYAAEEFRTNPENHNVGVAGIGKRAPMGGPEYTDDGLGSSMAPTKAARLKASTAMADTDDFMDKMAIVLANYRTEHGEPMDNEAIFTDPEQFAAWLTNRGQDDPLLAPHFQDFNAPWGGDTEDRGTWGADPQWERIVSGGETSWGQQITVGAIPGGGTQWHEAASQEAKDLGSQGGTGYFVKQRGISDLSDKQQAAILARMARPDFNNTSSSHPTADGVRNPAIDATITDLAGGPLPAFNHPSRPGDRSLDEYLAFDELTQSGEEISNDEIKALEDLTDGNEDIAKESKDILDVSDDSLAELKKILIALNEQDVSAVDMAQMSGMTGGAFATNIQTEGGRKTIRERIARYGQSGAFKGTSAEDTWMQAVMQLSDSAKADDFIWRAGEGAMRINRGDTVEGRLDASDLGGGGGGGSMHININGGDQAVVYQTVRRALKSAGM